MDMEVDRISELPEFIIQHILSFLETSEAAPTILVSKSWLRAWSTRPFLDFDYYWYYFWLDNSDEDEDAVIKRVDNTLKNYLEQGLRIVKFRLHEINTIEERWIKLLRQSYVTELDLEATYNWDASIWRQIFLTESLQVLKVASQYSLENVLVLSRTDIKCHNLKKLKLRMVRINDVTFQHIMCSCPTIEGLKLVHFRGLKVSAPNLGIPSVTIKGALFLNVGDSGSLKRLTLRTCDISDEQLQTIFSKNPHLEDLTLHNCDILKRINLSSLSLKIFNFNCPWSQPEIIIDAPNLQRLKNCSLLTIPFPITSPVAKGKVDVSLGYYSQQIDASWFHRLREFLAKFDKSNVKFTSCSSLTFNYKVLIATTPLPPRLQVEALTLKDQFPSLSLCYAFFTICHPKTVLLWCQMRISILESLKRLLKALSYRGSLECCTANPNKCWRHYIKDAKFYLVVDGNEQKPLDLNELEMRLAKPRWPAISLALEWECSD